MQAVILAAGLGKRFRPLTDRTPKPMLPLRGKPILEHTLESLPQGIHHVLVVVHYLGKQIEEHFGKVFGNKRITYVREEALKGTADALFTCQEFLEPEKFLVCMGDDLYLKRDLERCLDHDLAILVCAHRDPQRFGVVEVDDSGHFVGIEEKPEKPKSKLVNTGVYILDKEIFAYKKLKPACTISIR